MSEYSDDELLDGIGRALRARDLEAVAALLRVLAVQAPAKAQAVLDAAHGRITVEVA